MLLDESKIIYVEEIRIDIDILACKICLQFRITL